MLWWQWVVLIIKVSSIWSDWTLPVLARECLVLSLTFWTFQDKINYLTIVDYLYSWSPFPKQFHIQTINLRKSQSCTTTFWNRKHEAVLSDFRPLYWNKVGCFSCYYLNVTNVTAHFELFQLPPDAAGMTSQQRTALQASCWTLISLKCSYVCVCARAHVHMCMNYISLCVWERVVWNCSTSLSKFIHFCRTNKAGLMYKLCASSYVGALALCQTTSNLEFAVSLCNTSVWDVHYTDCILSCNSTQATGYPHSGNILLYVSVVEHWIHD